MVEMHLASGLSGVNSVPHHCLLFLDACEHLENLRVPERAKVHHCEICRWRD